MNYCRQKPKWSDSAHLQSSAVMNCSGERLRLVNNLTISSPGTDLRSVPRLCFHPIYCVLSCSHDADATDTEITGSNVFFSTVI